MHVWTCTDMVVVRLPRGFVLLEDHEHVMLPLGVCPGESGRDGRLEMGSTAYAIVHGGGWWRFVLVLVYRFR